MAALLLAVIAVAIPGPVCAAAYYVSPTGSDTNSGSITSPFKTIQHAVSVMSTSSIKTTYVRAGEYFFNGSSLTLNSADSGIQLLGYPGEAPILSGGFQVTTWTSQSSPAGSWSAPFPSGFSTSSPTDMPPGVSFDGQWYDIARSPNLASGGNRYNDPSDYFFVSSDIDAYHFYFRNTDINSSNYNSEPTAGIGIWSYNGWGFDPLPISSVNLSTKEVTMVNGSQFGIGNNSRYFLYGTKGCLDVAGEYYVDTANSKLWIIPPAGVNPNSHTVVISESEGPSVIEINGANNVLISGFQFRDETSSGRWDNAVGNFAPAEGGVRIDKGDSDTVVNNSFTCTGLGVDLESPNGSNGNGATNCLVAGNDIFNTFTGAISLGGSNTLANNRAIANYIHDTGLWEQGARAVWSSPAPNDVAYNLIVNVPHDAIIFGDGATSSNGLTIEYNNIQHASQGSDDTSAIYLKNGGNYNSSKPEVVRYNYVTDTGGAEFNSSGTLSYPGFSFGVYLDATTNQNGVWMGQSGTQIYGNVIAQAGQGGVFPHDGENNNIYDNIFADSAGSQQIMESSNNPWSNTFEKNIFYYGNSLDPIHLDTIYTNALYTEQYTMADNDYYNWYNGNANYYWSPFVDVYGPTGVELNSSNGYPQWPLDWANWTSTSNGGSPSVNEDAGSIQSNPGFLVPSYSWAPSYYFELASSSPAFSLGFTQPPIMQMGPQGSASPAVRINCSGSTPDWPFSADTDYSGGNWSGYGDTINTSAPNSATPGIYDTARYGTFSYTIPGFAPGSEHTVRLHFCEFWYGISGRGGTGTGPGSRLFNVTINGTQVLSNFDVFSTAGGADIADVEQFSTLANSSGQIVISFAPASGSPDPNAICNGIEIDPTPQQAIAQIDAGGSAVSPFVADVDYSGGSVYSYSDTINASAVNSAPASVYDSGRQGSSFSYQLTGLKPGSPHIVRLHFAELYYGVSGRGGTSTGIGSRFFNVSINGTQMLSNYDVYAAAAGPDIAVVDQLPAIADSNGDITISFAGASGSPDSNAIVSGIEVY
jgi:hypothetical protein